MNKQLILIRYSSLNGLRVLPVLIIPMRKTDVCRKHHAIPFAICHFFIIIICQFFIICNALFYFFCIIICCCHTILRIKLILRCIQIHQLNICPCNRRIINKSIITCLCFFRKFAINVVCHLFNAVAEMNHFTAFTVVCHMIGIRICYFRTAVTMHSCICFQNRNNFFFDIVIFYNAAKLLFYPAADEIIGFIWMIDSHSLIIISKCHVVGKRKFLRTDISDIDNPQIFNTVLICHGKLLPYFWKRCRINPFIGNRRTMIIKMIIQTKTGFSVAVFLDWQCTHISKVIVRQKKNRVIKRSPVF